MPSMATAMLKARSEMKVVKSRTFKFYDCKRKDLLRLNLQLQAISDLGDGVCAWKRSGGLLKRFIDEGCERNRLI